MGDKRLFHFDHVLDKTCSQKHVYSTCVHPLLDGVLRGYNATVLAYGQTGSGKTFSMGSEVHESGVAGHPKAGVLPRLSQDLFAALASRAGRKPGYRYSVHASYLEIHKERIRDLLRPTEDKLPIREDATGRVYVAGLHQEELGSFAEVMSSLQRGALSRSTGATKMNTRSSRSHAIFTLSLKQWLVCDEEGTANEKPSASPAEEASTDAKQDESKNDEFSVFADGSALLSVFRLVDLAGSERAKKTGASGARLAEGIKINAGLLALGNVISILGDPKKKNSGAHVPYRDSKLTRLLQPSLGGNSRTVMLACVSPADSNFDETVNTLRYASRARNIQNAVVQNKGSEGEETARLKRQVESLRRALLRERAARGVAPDSEALRERVRAVTIERDQWRLLAERAGAGDEAKADSGETRSIVAEQAEKILCLEAENRRAEAQIQLLLQQAACGVDPLAEATALDETESLNDGDDGAPSAFTATASPEAERLQQEMEKVASLVAAKADLLKSAQDPDALDAARHKYLRAIRDLEFKLVRAEAERDKMRGVMARAEKAAAAGRAPTLHETRLREKLKKLNATVKDLKQSMSSQRRQLAEADRQRQAAIRLKRELAEAKRRRTALAQAMKKSEKKHRQQARQQTLKMNKLEKQRRKQGLALSSLRAQKDRQGQMLRVKTDRLTAMSRRLRLAHQRHKSAGAMRSESARVRAQLRRRKMMRGLSVEKWLDQEVRLDVRARGRSGRVARLVAARATANKEAQSLPDGHPNRRRLEIRVKGLSKQIQALQTRSLETASKGGVANAANNAGSACPASKLLPKDADTDVRRAVSWLFERLISATASIEKLKKAEKVKKAERRRAAAASAPFALGAAGAQASKSAVNVPVRHRSAHGVGVIDENPESTSEDEWEAASESSDYADDQDNDPDYVETPIMQRRRRRSQQATKSRRASKGDTIESKPSSQNATPASVQSTGSTTTASASASAASTPTPPPTRTSEEWITELKKSRVRLTVKDLKAELQRRGLPRSGRKADLVERLLAAVQADGASGHSLPPTTPICSNANDVTAATPSFKKSFEKETVTKKKRTKPFMAWESKETPVRRKPAPSVDKENHMPLDTQALEREWQQIHSQTKLFVGIGKLKGNPASRALGKPKRRALYNISNSTAN